MAHAEQRENNVARRPALDFVIAGAPKCGTTALFEYLAQNPTICPSKEKEPHYYARDLPKIRKVCTADEYDALFAADANDVRRRGEASVWYLYSTAALPALLEENPDCRVIVMLRDPVDAAAALHNQLVRVLYEDEPDFETAWRLQDDRARGQRIPPLCPEPRLLQYRNACSYGEQIARAKSHVPPDQLLVIASDEFRSGPRATYLRIIDFIGADDDGREDFDDVNVARAWRSARLQRLLSRPGGRLGGSIMWFKYALNRHGIHPLQYVRPLITRPAPREPIEPQFVGELRDAFAADVALLEKVLDRKFGWLP